MISSVPCDQPGTPRLLCLVGAWRLRDTAIAEYLVGLRPARGRLAWKFPRAVVRGGPVERGGGSGGAAGAPLLGGGAEVGGGATLGAALGGGGGGAPRESGPCILRILFSELSGKRDSSEEQLASKRNNRFLGTMSLNWTYVCDLLLSNDRFERILLPSARTECPC